MSVEELKAKISVIDDNATRNLERITKSFERQYKEMERLKLNMKRLRDENKLLKGSMNGLEKTTKVHIDTTQAERSVNRLERALNGLKRTASGLGNIGRGIGSFGRGLMPGYGTVAAVAGTGYLGKSLFDKTVGAAATAEQSQYTIQAMFDSDKKGNAYIKRMQDYAITSPLFNSQDILSNSKSFISLTKDGNQLEKMWNLSERLLAVDPAQGVEGAVFALRELFSGDPLSLARRFELPKKELKEISKLDFPKQLMALDKFFNKMRMTDKLVEKMGSSSLGLWNQVMESQEVAMRKIGDPVLKVFKPYLEKLTAYMQSNKINKFVSFGQKMAKGIAEGFIDISKSVGHWINDIVNNPEFQKLNTIGEKFNFVLDDISIKFRSWYDEKGNALIQDLTNKGLNAAGQTIMDAAPNFFEFGLKLGAAVLDGISQSLLDLGGKIAGWIESKQPKAAHKFWFGETYEEGMAKTKAIKDREQHNKNAAKGSMNFKARAMGESRVPRDNTPYLLHEGERVQTKQQANQQDNNNPSILITGNTFTVREEADIDKIVDRLVKRIQQARVSFGGAIE